jgi:hypothetical protein
MTSNSARLGRWLLTAAGVLFIPVLFNGTAGADSKKAAPAPAKAAPAAKVPSTPHSSSGGGGTAGHPGGAGGTTSHGPTTGGTHTGPTTSNPGGHSTTTTTGSHTTTTTAGGHTTTTTGGSHTTEGGAHSNVPGGAHNTSVAGGAHAGGAPRTATGRPAPAGAKTVSTKSGSAVTRRPDGHVSDVHDAHRNMDIHHNLNGGRRVSVERADHSRIVAERGRRGYIERRYNYHGHEYGRRAYYYHGHEYNRYYRGYYYRGAYVNVYAPGFYYAPAFYGWAYNPWYAPVPYAWGWAPNPWYGYYGYYFAPYPVYAAPAFWLTDYLIAAELQAAFAARAAAESQGELIPPSLYLCEHGGCGTLARDGQHFSGTLSDGSEMSLTVAKWDAQSVVLTRTGASGNTTFAGSLITPTMIAGTVSGFRNGQPVSEAWTASANAPVFVASNGGGFFGADAAASPAMTPEIKQMVSDEVKAQIALENSEATQNSQGQDADPASSGIERLMSDGKPHVFVAGDALDVVDASGAECALSDGDVLQLSAPPPEDSTDAKLLVLSSKGAKECAKSATVTVAVTDLQEMQNHLRETIDQGLGELKDKQGTGGLPAAPPSAKAPPVQTAFAQNAPPEEKDGEQAVNQQLSEADQAEKQTTAEAAQDSGDTTTAQASAPAAVPTQAAPVSIEVGQTVDQVTESLGQPLTIIDLGTKKIYKYKDMKITFKGGKVSDVE